MEREKLKAIIDDFEDKNSRNFGLKNNLITFQSFMDEFLRGMNEPKCQLHDTLSLDKA